MKLLIALIVVIVVVSVIVSFLPPIGGWDDFNNTGGR